MKRIAGLHRRFGVIPPQVPKDRSLPPFCREMLDRLPRRAGLRRSALLASPLLLALGAAAAPAAAPDDGFQSTVALDRAAAAFTGRVVGEDGGARTPVDPRLKLAPCPTLSLAWRTDGHDAVTVTCTGPAWRIFVPVRTPATTVASVPIGARIIAAPVIRRGDPVTIAAGSNGFSITRDGISLGDAAPGARFLVRIDDSRAPVQAVAIEAGRATLPGWNE